jgi:uncharacterized membrane protein YgdD (TMEM256/DUF423 family)
MATPTREPIVFRINLFEVGLAHLRSLFADKPVIIATIVLSVVSFGFLAVQHTMAGDEWTAFHLNHYQDVWNLQIGRWLEPVVHAILADNALAPTFTLVLLVFIEMIAFLVGARIIGLTDSFAKFAFISTSMFFPFWAEAVNFRMLHATMAIGLLFSVAYGAFGWKSFKCFCSENRISRIRTGMTYLGVAALLFSFSGSLYQGVIQFGTIILLGAAINHLILAENKNKSISFRTIGIFLSVVLSIVFIGSLLYAMEVTLSQRVLHINPVSASGSQATYAGRFISHHDARHNSLTI